MDWALLSKASTKIVVDEFGCWLWAGSKTASGYAVLRIQENGKSVLRRVHRLLYTELVGAIPADLVPDHLCRVRHCVNPDHIEPVTQRENTMRGLGPARFNAEKTHCDEGHPLSGTNLRVNAKTGQRICKTCQNRAARDYRARERNS
jgi:hypothetical protein